jgi:hypothetical protein
MAPNDSPKIGSAVSPPLLDSSSLFDAGQSHGLRCRGSGATRGFLTVSLSDAEPVLTRLRGENRERERRVRERGKNRTKSIIRLEYMIESDTGYIEAKKQITTDGSTQGGNTGREYM